MRFASGFDSGEAQGFRPGLADPEPVRSAPDPAHSRPRGCEGGHGVRCVALPSDRQPSTDYTAQNGALLRSASGLVMKPVFCPRPKTQPVRVIYAGRRRRTRSGIATQVVLEEKLGAADTGWTSPRWSKRGSKGSASPSRPARIFDLINPEDDPALSILRSVLYRCRRAARA